MFLKEILETFLCLGHKFCVRNKCCARGQTGKHLCPQHCVLVCHRLKATTINLLLRFIFVPEHFPTTMYTSTSANSSRGISFPPPVFPLVLHSSHFNCMVGDYKCFIIILLLFYYYFMFYFILLLFFIPKKYFYYCVNNN